MAMLTAAEVWRDFNVAGVPASGVLKPSKRDVRAWGAYLESLLNGSPAGLAYATLAALGADLAHDPNTTAIVYGDSTAANNGLYIKSGASGAGSWSRIDDLPGAVVPLTVTGGTADAIIATASESPTTPAKKLYILVPTAANTGATTIAVNGGSAVDIKSALNASLAANALLPDCAALMIWNVDHYQLLVSSPVDATGILADAVDAKNDAEAAAASATASAAILGSAISFYLAPQGRLTLTQGVPVPATSVAGAALLYYNPFAGNQYPRYDGTVLVSTQFPDELVASVTDTAKNPAAIGASKVNDWFVWQDSATFTVTIASPGVFTYNNHGLAADQPVKFTTSGALPTGLTAGTTYYVISTGLSTNNFRVSATKGGSVVNTSGSQSGTHTITIQRLTHGPDWTNDTTRSAGTALVLVNGIYLNSVSITNGPAASRGTYVGTTRSNGSSTLDFIFGALASGGTAGNFGLWNAYNRVPFNTFVGDTTSSWTYTPGVAATWRAANNSSTIRIYSVRGLNIDSIRAEYAANGTAGASANATVGVGLDQTAGFNGTTQFSQAASASVGLVGRFVGLMGLGYHYVSANENNSSSSVSVTFHGNPAAYVQTGLHAEMWQ